MFGKQVVIYANFNDPMTDNKDNKKRYRVDDLLSQQKNKVIDNLCRKTIY